MVFGDFCCGPLDYFNYPHPSSKNSDMPTTKKKDDSPKKIEYLMLRGAHSEGGKIYVKGDKFFSDNPNLLNHNTAGAPRFALANEVLVTSAPQASSPDGLEEMSVPELKAYAEEGEINLAGTGGDKSKIVKKIRDNQ